MPVGAAGNDRGGGDGDDGDGDDVDDPRPRVRRRSPTMAEDEWRAAAGDAEEDGRPDPTSECDDVEGRYIAFKNREYRRVEASDACCFDMPVQWAMP